VVLGKILLRSLIGAILTLWFISIVLFAAVDMLPGDAAEALLGRNATPVALKNLRKELHLDEPVVTRYVNWLGRLAQGDLGRSITTQKQIAPVLSERLGNTLFLATTAALVAVPLAIILGLLAALNPGGVLDRTLSILSLASIAVPEFLVGYILFTVFALHLRWLPILSSISPDMSLAEELRRVALPALTLIFLVMAYMMRITRATVMNELARPYIEMARLKGCSPLRIITVHALFNAFGPIANAVALSLAYLTVGVVVVEFVFTFPGIGQWMVDAVSKQDIAVVQICGLVFGAIYICLNALADMIGIVSDPRLRHPR